MLTAREDFTNVLNITNYVDDKSNRNSFCFVEHDTMKISINEI